MEVCRENREHDMPSRSAVVAGKDAAYVGEVVFGCHSVLRRTQD